MNREDFTEHSFELFVDNLSLKKTTDDHLTSISGISVSGLTTYNYGYDNNGKVTSKSDNVGAYTYTYDTQNRVTQEIQDKTLTRTRTNFVGTAKQ